MSTSSTGVGLRRIGAVQIDVRIGDVAGNRSRILNWMERGASEGVELLVFPECALPGYCFSSREEAAELAEPIHGPSVEHLTEGCRRLGIAIVVGMLEKDERRLFNTCALLGPSGLLGTYRKVHLPFLGVDRFTDPGDRPFEVHDVNGLHVGMHICYDGAFPEVARVMSLLGADLIVLPTNWPKGMEAGAQHMIPCRALENTVYALASDRVGEERGYQFIGRSSIASPRGEILASAGPDEETLLIADIDLKLARQKRIVRIAGEHEIDRIKDRRPSYYGELTKPNGRE